MTISAEPIIYILIFVAVLMLVEGIYLTVFGKSISLNNRVSRRLTLMEKGANREQVLEQLRKEMGQHMSAGGIPLYSILANKANISATAGAGSAGGLAAFSNPVATHSSERPITAATFAYSFAGMSRSPQFAVRCLL
jgi:tight adherence protein B